MLSFWDKTRINTFFFQYNIFFDQTFNIVIVFM